MTATDWLVAYISPRRESAVVAELAEHPGAETYLPTIPVYRRKCRPGTEKQLRQTSHQPIFPRYLFARGIDPSLLAHVRYVAGLISTAEGPLTFPNALMPGLRLLCAAHARGPQRPEWQIGDWVRPGDESPLAGFLGQITALANGATISVDFASARLGVVRMPARDLIAAVVGPAPY